MVSFPRHSASEGKEKSRLTAIENNCLNARLLAQVIETLACWVKTMSWQVDGSTHSSSFAIGSAHVHQKEVLMFVLGGFLVPEQLEDLSWRHWHRG